MEQERALEFETRRLSGMQLMAKPVNDQSYFGYSMDGLKVSEGIILTYCLVFLASYVSYCHFNFNKIISSIGHLNLPSSEQFTRLFDVLNSGSTSDDKFKHTDTNYTDQERYRIDLE